jgi:hypothetical protein
LPPSQPDCTIADRCEAQGLTCGEGGACIVPTSEPIPFDYDAQFAFPDATALDDVRPVQHDAGIDGSMDATCGSVESDPRICGRCGNACTVPTNAMATCSAGRCGFTCNPGYADCDRDPANGCETNTRIDRLNCGGCGNACTVMNGTPSCTMGTCGIASCIGYFADCDGNPINGCEVNLFESTTHCGMCGRRCPTNSVCRFGACYCDAGMCDAGIMDAGMMEAGIMDAGMMEAGIMDARDAREGP